MAFLSRKCHFSIDLGQFTTIYLYSSRPINIKRLKVMKTLFGLMLAAMLMASCSSTHNFESRTYSTSDKKWKPVKDRTPYYKVMKVAERD